jgi:hypothetical protein
LRIPQNFFKKAKLKTSSPGHLFPSLHRTTSSISSIVKIEKAALSSSDIVEKATPLSFGLALKGAETFFEIGSNL